MRRNHLVSLAILAVFGLACSAGGAKQNGTTGAGGKPATANIGQPVRDGKFEFTVQKIKCGVSQIGTSVLGERAQGQFCLVTLKVTNIGKQAQTFDGSNQFAYGSGGAKYDADTTADLYVNKAADTFLNDINPGNSVTGVIVFDIPKTAKLAKLELHDSPFSGGVLVVVK